MRNIQSTKEQDAHPGGYRAGIYQRFWARWIDYFLLFMLFVSSYTLLNHLLIALDNRFYDIMRNGYANLISHIVILCGIVCAESFLLVRWGSTPGKALLDIEMTRMDGGRPGWRDALKRELHVMSAGCGFLVPPFVLAPLWWMYRAARYGYKFPWDEKSGIRLQVHPTNVVRKSAAIVIIGLSIPAYILMQVFFEEPFPHSGIWPDFYVALDSVPDGPGSGEAGPPVDKAGP